MCIGFLLWRCHPLYRLHIALNRDETFSRPTAPVHWWPGESGILAGKDLCKGGTWFGCTKYGRLALITNFREVEYFHQEISRGDLVTSFLEGSKSPLEYAKDVSKAGDKFNGFNILVADIHSGEMAYVSNRPKDSPSLAQIVPPGFHALCNASLDTPWPKVLRGAEIMENIIQEVGLSEIPKERVVKELLMDDVKADDKSLPNTGCTLEWEREMSSIYVNCDSDQGPYGTRSMIVLSVDINGKTELLERYLEDGCWKEHEFSFDIVEQVYPHDSVVEQVYPHTSTIEQVYPHTSNMEQIYPDTSDVACQ